MSENPMLTAPALPLTLIHERREGEFCELRNNGVLRSSCTISPRRNTILGDAHPSQREHPVAVTWPRDRRVKAQDRYLPSF
jgi:hypothetical protein